MKKTLAIVGLSMTLGFAGALAGMRPKTVSADQNEPAGANEDGSVTINETNFPDQNFREYVKKIIDGNGNNLVDIDERGATTEIRVDTTKVRSVKGVEYFYQLQTLIAHPGEEDWCTDDMGKGKLQELDLRYNPNLVFLDCQRNRLKTLDLSGNPKLESLDCQRNSLTSLNLSHNPEIVGLECSYNQLTSLDLSRHTKLIGVLCDYNQITYLDVSNAPQLDTFSCQANQLVELRLGAKPNLVDFSCDDNKLASLDVSGCKIVQWLGCSMNQITYIDVSGIPTLQVLECSYNQIAYLDVSHNLELQGLLCQANQLTDLALGENKNLTHLNAHYNKMTRINIHNCATLIEELTDPSMEKSVVSDEQGEYYQYYLGGETPVLTVDLNTAVIMRPPRRGEGPTIEDFVERLYTVALGRASEAKGKEYWVNEITSGRRTGGYCAEFFLTGEEFMNRKLSTEDFVETLYKTFFNRASEPNGKAYWVNALKTGAYTKEAVVRGFIDSTEWCNLCADYGVRSGAPTAKAERASKNATDFAKRLYTCCLKRKPEDAGLKYWSLALTNLEQTGAGAAKRFFESKEFLDLKTSDEEYVSRLYTTFMDREADQSGFDHWVKALKSGTSRAAVLSAFASSQEFTNICAEYGIERGVV